MSIRLNGSTSGYTEIDAPAVAGSNTIVLPSGNGSANQLLKNGSTAGTLGWSSMVEDSSGRVLLGTSTSNQYNWYSNNFKFQIVGTSADAGSIQQTVFEASQYGAGITLGKSRAATAGTNTIVQNNDNLGGLAFVGADGTNWIRGAAIDAYVDGTPGTNDLPGRLVFSTTADGASSPTERMRINNSGNVLIGKTVDNQTTLGININQTGTISAASNADAGIFYRTTSSAGDGVILTKSNIGGTNTLVGAGYANGTFAAVSDATKKKNIETARNYLSDVMQLRVVKYNWKSDEDNAPKELGWIAQEVEEVFPGMVSEMEGSKLLKKEVFVPMLMKCIQEQQAIIERLEERITALEAS